MEIKKESPVCLTLDNGVTRDEVRDLVLLIEQGESIPRVSSEYFEKLEDIIKFRKHLRALGFAVI